jgi:metal-responsive CopG/Arc/MetJ family transcriptional regulator
MLIGVAMKTAISLPDAVFTEAEALAKQLGLSRSELYSRALQAFLSKYDRQQILSRLNEVYAFRVFRSRPRASADAVYYTALRNYPLMKK